MLNANRIMPCFLRLSGSRTVTFDWGVDLDQLWKQLAGSESMKTGGYLEYLPLSIRSIAPRINSLIGS